MIPSLVKSSDTPNPYQKLLSEGLESQKVQVKHWSDCRKGLLPIFQAALLKNKSINIIHIHWVHPFISQRNRLFFILSSIRFLVDVLSLRLAGKKIVWTVHNLTSHDSRFLEWELWVRRQLVRLVDKIICLNKITLESIIKEYQFNPAKAVVIPHGHYRGVYHSPIELNQARKLLNLPESGLLYLNFGLLRPYKGIENLLQVWKENEDSFAGDTLLIVGRALNEDYVKNLKDLSREVNGVVIVPKFVKNSELHLYFSAANIVVLPFKKILNSGSLILAMSFGKPVIAPRLGGLLEAVGEGDKLFYDPEDDLGLQKAMQNSRSVNLDHLSELITNACDRLDWESISQKTFRVYQMLVL